MPETIPTLQGPQGVLGTASSGRASFRVGRSDWRRRCFGLPRNTETSVRLLRNRVPKETGA
jgi:hypothetical protein